MSNQPNPSPMDEKQTTLPPPPVATPPAGGPPSEPTPEDDEFNQQMRTAGIVAGVVVLILVVLVALASWWMFNNPAETAVLRDMFIIFMAFMLVFNGMVMVVLLVQIARLTNMLQNEIKPILENTNETMQVVRGTALFVSENLSTPVTQINSYVAGVSRFLELIIPGAAKPPKTE